MSPADKDNPAEVQAAHILVVEDEALIRFAIADELRGLGNIVAEAATAEEAWQLLSSGVHIDLVFSDLRLPGAMSGADLAARIHKTYPGVPVIITSSHSSSPDWPGPLLQKPYDLQRTAADLTRRARGVGESNP